MQRGETVEPVKALFRPDGEGNASTTIDDLKGAEAVMVTREPAGGTKVPTTTPFVKVPVEEARARAGRAAPAARRPQRP